MKRILLFAFISALTFGGHAQICNAAYSSQAYHRCMDKCIRSGTSLTKPCSELCRSSNR